MSSQKEELNDFGLESEAPEENLTLFKKAQILCDIEDAGGLDFFGTIKDLRSYPVAKEFYGKPDSALRKSIKNFIGHYKHKTPTERMKTPSLNEIYQTIDTYQLKAHRILQEEDDSTLEQRFEKVLKTNCEASPMNTPTRPTTRSSRSTPVQTPSRTPNRKSAPSEEHADPADIPPLLEGLFTHDDLGTFFSLLCHCNFVIVLPR